MHIFKIDLSDAEKQNINDYKCIQEVFTRKIKLDKRDQNWIKNGQYLLVNCENTLTSPADSIFTEYGIIEKNQMQNYQIQVKQTKVNITDFLGRNSIMLENNNKKLAYFIFYLSPRYYHHYHSSFNFKTQNIEYIEGQLYPVNQNWRQQAILNSRIVISGVSKINDISRNTFYIPVAALNVSDMQLLKGNKSNQQYDTYNYYFKQGEEIGQFNFGSTVVIVIELDKDEEIQILSKPGSFYYVGKQIAKINKK